VEAAWKEAGRRASVVGQDKGSESRRFALLAYSFALRPFVVIRGESRDVGAIRGPRVAASRARRLVAIATAALAGAALLGLAGHIFQLRITLTDSSAPVGIYRLIAAPAGRGALVAACLPAAIVRMGLARGYLGRGDCPAGAEPVAKVIGALRGDVVEVEPGWTAVNGVRFTNSRTSARDSAGRALAHVAWGAHRVLPGEVWLFGFNDARSWDARYFGPAPAGSIRGVLRPVLIW
jgi:conjugative transfer signal peptidase TraF